MMSVLLFSLLPAWAEETDEAAIEAAAEAVGPDRSGAPPVRDPAPLDLADAEVHALSNGLQVQHIRIPRLRKVSVRLTWWQGRTELVAGGVDPHQLELMNELWGVSSETWDPAALSELEDVNDMVAYAGVYDHSTTVALEVPAEKLPIGLDLMADVAFRPTYPKREVKLEQEATERWYATEAVKSPGTVASELSRFAWYPADHPYGVRPDPEAFARVKAKQLPAVHQTATSTGPVSMVVVGDLDWSALEPELEARFGAFSVAEGERAAHLAVPAPERTRVFAVDMPSSEQASILMRLEAPARGEAESVLLQASTWALGGHFLSRLNKNLREEKGWTYGVRAGYQTSPEHGWFRVKVDVPADKLAPAVTEIEHELERVVVEGVTEEELTAWWRGEVKDFNDTRGTLRSASGFYGSLDAHQETVADRVARLEAVAAVDRVAAQQIAATWLGGPAPRSWVVVGPREALETGFEALGWEVQWLEASDAVLGRLPGDPAP